MPSETATHPDDYARLLRYGAAPGLPLQAGEVAWTGARVSLAGLAWSVAKLFVTMFCLGFTVWALVCIAAVARGA